ncbi:winged helix-turn-helix transcriptional regulator [Halalkalicoccus ordinarius]|uniref:winged helix-turn-helix transcriptional regulator n=1 Tax=Halalkalicoccus ordinarius TaxID=3116651 RepID=UPI00300EBE47
MKGNIDRAQRVAETVDLISKKWHPVIIQRLIEDGPLGFNELKERIEDVSAKVLTDSLEDLTENELVERTVISESPLRVEYELTETGRELQGAMEALATWGDRHLDPEPNPTVLIVDDDPRLLNMHADWLEDDYTVERAYDGQEAFRKLDESVDVVLLDRRMPGLSGEEVLERIRGWGIDCRVVMLSAVDPDFDVLDMGFDGYVVKPGFRDEIRDVITDVLARDMHEQPVQEYLALSAKEALLRAEKTRTELRENDAYVRLVERLERLETELDETTERATEDERLRALIGGPGEQ